ncbi:hypothetical protein D3C72_1416840 [compost metagenome]
MHYLDQMDNLPISDLMDRNIYRCTVLLGKQLLRPGVGLFFHMDWQGHKILTRQ